MQWYCYYWHIIDSIGYFIKILVTNIFYILVDTFHFFSLSLIKSSFFFIYIIYLFIIVILFLYLIIIYILFTIEITNSLHCMFVLVYFNCLNCNFRLVWWRFFWIFSLSFFFANIYEYLVLICCPKNKPNFRNLLIHIYIHVLVENICVYWLWINVNV